MTAGIWHNFHYLWIGAITNAPSDRRTPPDYLPVAEQKVGGP